MRSKRVSTTMNVSMKMPSPSLSRVVVVERTLEHISRARKVHYFFEIRSAVEGAIREGSEKARLVAFVGSAQQEGDDVGGKPLQSFLVIPYHGYIIHEE